MDTLRQLAGKTPRTHGFTLVEMSVVIVVIALILGAIVEGQKLLHNQELNSVVSDVNHFKQAIALFKTKYRALPGDFSDAANRWPAKTVSGNGDGSWGIGETEGLRGWQQLYLSGILPDYNYTGSGWLAIGQNLPQSQINKGTGYQLVGQVTVFTEGHGNAIQLGQVNNTDFLTDGALSALDAMLVDTKMDDGKADQGDTYGVRGQRAGDSQCTSFDSTHAKPVDYVPADTVGLCYMLFWLDSDY